jgi:seryl-tRNA synthetase
MPPKKKVGRPRLPDTNTDPELLKKRLYMRDYNARIISDIQKLDKLEQECQDELKQIKQERNELQKEYKKSIKMLQEANQQASDILKESTKSKK